VREHLDYGVQLWVQSASSLWVKIQFAGNNHLPLFVGSVYLPPAGSPLLHRIDINQRLNELQGIVNEIGDHGHILLAGDLIAKIACVSTSQGENVRLVGQNTYGRKVMEFVQQTSMRLCTGMVEGDFHLPPSFRATVRSSPTRPDHVMVSQSLWEYLAFIKVASDLKGSDHYPLQTRVIMRGEDPPTATEDGPYRHRIVWDASKRTDYVVRLEGMES
jgi:exonuclease III